MDSHVILFRFYGVLLVAAGLIFALPRHLWKKRTQNIVLLLKGQPLNSQPLEAHQNFAKNVASRLKNTKTEYIRTVLLSILVDASSIVICFGYTYLANYFSDSFFMKSFSLDLDTLNEFYER